MKPYVDLERLLEELTKAVNQLPTINPMLMKSRLWCPDVAYSGPKDLSLTKERGYIFVSFEWLEGREEALQEQLREALRKPLKKIKEQIEGKMACSITFEIFEIPRRLHETL